MGGVCPPGQFLGRDYVQGGLCPTPPHHTKHRSAQVVDCEKAIGNKLFVGGRWTLTCLTLVHIPPKNERWGNETLCARISTYQGYCVAFASYTE